MAVPTVQVIVTDELKQRLQSLAQAQGLSTSSYLRVLINRHLLSIDRATINPAQNLHEVYN